MLLKTTVFLVVRERGPFREVISAWTDHATARDHISILREKNKNTVYFDSIYTIQDIELNPASLPKIYDKPKLCEELLKSKFGADDSYCLLPEGHEGRHCG